MSATVPARPRLQPGDRVSYVMPVDSASAGQTRGAVVVRVFDANPNDVMLNLQVFTDGSNDRQVSPMVPIEQDPYAKGMIWRTSVHQDEDTLGPHTWHHYRPTFDAPIAKAPTHADADPADRGEMG